MQGVCEARVTEIPPGKTLPPVKLAIDEAVYVLQGRGLTTVWRKPGAPKKTFEWQTRSLFLAPNNHFHQFSNTQGDRPVRLLHCNYLPIAMSAVQDPAFFFNNPYEAPELLAGRGEDFFAEAKAVQGQIGSESVGARAFWYGNFFPDMRAWDKLYHFKGRGAGGHVVWVQFPNSENWAHMSVFPSRTYKKAHRHGPGVIIVIPAGEGYSIMWPEGQEKVVIPWHEGSVFVPPNRWFHQHFNVGSSPGRYLALHAPRSMRNMAERVEDRARDQIEYPEEDSAVRQRFEAELKKRSLTSIMPEEAYRNRAFEWKYEGDR
jgi:gentisate 1,2-dioxygenase